MIRQVRHCWSGLWNLDDHMMSEARRVSHYLCLVLKHHMTTLTHGLTMGVHYRYRKSKELIFQIFNKQNIGWDNTQLKAIKNRMIFKVYLNNKNIKLFIQRCQEFSYSPLSEPSHNYGDKWQQEQEHKAGMTAGTGTQSRDDSRNRNTKQGWQQEQEHKAGMTAGTGT